jgi:hypothetical protein
VSDRLREPQAAAALMHSWGGEVADRHVRFVVGNEPIDRLVTLGAQVRAVLGAAEATA